MTGIIWFLLLKVYYAESVTTDSGCNTTLTCVNNTKLGSYYYYRWDRYSTNVTPIKDGHKYSGADTETLTIINTYNNDTGTYRCNYSKDAMSSRAVGTTYDLHVRDNTVWSCWEAWRQCKVSFGKGTRQRVRHCKSSSCTPQTQSDYSSCVCDICPIDGKWSDWPTWNTCSVTCGGGTQSRTRKCNNPSPFRGGKACEGNKTVSMDCAEKSCSVDGKWSEWPAWNTCPVTCGGRIQNRTRQCNNPSPSGGGKDCFGSNAESMDCAEKTCPVDGKWSVWPPWNTCPVTCGGRTQSRTRQCNNPYPSGGGKDCAGIKTDSKDCAEKRCPVDGMWSYWSQWDTCSVTCGGGTQYRYRQCNNPSQSAGGKYCVGSSRDDSQCGNNRCPVDGMWSGWSLSGGCPVTCGGGFQSIDRRCDNPAPAFGGEICKGQHTATTRCGTAPCPVDGKWSDWSQWDTCSATCDGGTQYRYRRCNNPPRSAGGKNCVGSSRDDTQCGTNRCPDWALWGAWGSCETPCGEGWKRRTRTCIYVGKVVDKNKCKGNQWGPLRCHITPCHGNISGTLAITGKSSCVWYNDRQRIDLYYTKKYALIKGGLSIQNLEYTDKGKYKCGYRGHYTEIIIHGSPTILTRKDKYYANTGSSKTIECIIGPSNPNTTSLWWTKMNSLGHTTAILHDRRSGKYNGGTLTTPDLTINSVDATDNGTYMCYGNNSYGTSSATTTFIVGDVPVVNIPQKYYVSIIDVSVTLQCTVQNGNGSTLYWKKMGNILSSARDKYYTTAENPSLTISNLETRDSGTYDCIASNSFGEVSDSTELKVIYSQAPRIDYVKTANETALLQCVVNDFHTITWWHNNVTLQIQDSNKYSIGDSKEPDLTINNLTRLDSGTYMCESSVDDASARSDSIILKVKDIPFIEPSPTTMDVIVRHDVLLKCSYEAFPKPHEIHWEKDGDKLSIDHVKYNGSSLEEPSLTILMSEVADSGSYSCVVQNAVGKRTSEEIELCITEPESTFSPGPVAGGIGAVLVVVCVVLCVIVRRRRRVHNGKKQPYNSGVSLAEPSVNYRPGTLNTSAVSNDNHPCGSIMIQNDNIPSGSLVVQNNTGDGHTYYNMSDIITKVKVDDLMNCIAMKQTTDALKEEYKKVPYGSQYPTVQAQRKENMPKNRYKTTFPYDHSRVILEVFHGKANSDYINADYIDGFKKTSCYIACQGPVKHTIEDHWRMIWQTNISKIVMLTNLIEGGKVKCDRYWPKGGKPMDVENLNLTLTAEKERAAYITREISVVDKKTGQQRYIIQYHFTAWPDHGTPDPLYLVLFHKHVATDSKIEETGPLLVHCSAGIGRTGTYIALDALFEEGLATGYVDIAPFLAKMRDCRMSMIQTAEQYICLHYALLEAFTMKDTCIRKENSNNFWREILSDKRPINQNKLHEEFKMLKSQISEHRKSEYTTALSTANISKNRNRNVQPMDTTRLFLVSFGRGRSDYINAVTVSSYTTFVGYITTQLPLPDTKVDFWTMINDHNSSTIVLLLEDMKEIECVYSTSESFTCGPFTIKVKKPKIGDHGITEASLMLSKKNDRPKEVALYQAVCKSAPEPAVLCRLVNLISSRVSLSSDPVTVVSSDGAKNCGLFCALTNAVSSMQIDKRVDIFQIVRLLQLRRPEFFTDFNEYRLCYEALNFHIETSNVYENF